MRTNQDLSGQRFAVERCRDCAAVESCAFHGIPEMKSLGERAFYGPNFTALRQGSQASRVFIICSGWLQVAHMTSEGRAVIALAGPGEFLGMTGALSGGVYAASAKTLEESELLAIDRERFLSFLENHPAVCVKVLKAISRQWQKTLNHIYDLAGKVHSEQRLLRSLLDISDNCGSQKDGGVRINVPLSIQVLADTIGCSRQWTSKLLGDLERKGLVRRKSGWITLTEAAFRDTEIDRRAG